MHVFVGHVRTPSALASHPFDFFVFVYSIVVSHDVHGALEKSISGIHPLTKRCVCRGRRV